MASPKQNVAFTWRQAFYLGSALVASPTLAAGDAVVYTAGVSTGNLNTLTSQTYGADCTASATQMNGADVLIQFTDQTVPRAWDPFTIRMNLDVRNVDDLATTAALGAPVGVSIAADLAAVQADTTNMKTRLPAALVGGRMDSSVGAMANGVITTVSFAAAAIDNTVLSTNAKQSIADAMMATAVDGATTMKQITQIIASAVAGRLSGAATTTITIRDVNDSRNCIVATVDANGNRTATTYTVV